MVIAHQCWRREKVVSQPWQLPPYSGIEAQSDCRCRDYDHQDTDADNGWVSILFDVALLVL